MRSAIRSIGVGNRVNDTRRLTRAATGLVALGLVATLTYAVPSAAAATPPSVPAGSVATQSSTFPGAHGAELAIDGNVSGDDPDVQSITQTNFEVEAWWHLDMQTSIQLDRVMIWNRTDCCQSRLADFYLFVSDVPFPATDVATTLADSNVTSIYHAGAAPTYVELAPGVTGRYLRIQLTGENYLSLAEVQVNTSAFTPLADETWGAVNQSRSLISGTDGVIFAIEQIGNTIYAGGKFQQVVRRRDIDPQVDQAFLAAFDATTGDFIDWWTPQFNGPIYALEASADGSRLYVGGEFTEVNGHPDTRGIVALDAATGMVDHTWFAMVENFYSFDPGVVRDIEESGGWLYIAGNFSHVQGIDPATRAFHWKVARLSPSTGAPDLSWRPEVRDGPGGGKVSALSHDPVLGRVYLAGFFDSVDNLPDTDRFAVVTDTDASVVTGLERFPELTPDQDHQFDVIAHGDYVWVAGTQHVVHMLNAADLSINRRWMTGFEPPHHIGGDYQGLAILGDEIFATCHCWGVIRELPNWVTTVSEAVDIEPIAAETQGIMSFDLATGDLNTAWRPDTFGSLGGWALHGAADGCLWAGGDLHRTQVGDQWRNGLQRYCSSTGQGPPVGPPLTQAPPPETNPPTAPTDPTATESAGSATITWTASADDTAVAYYRIYRNGTYLGATRGLSFTDTAPPETAAYTVRAVDAYGTESADSMAVAPLLAGLVPPFLNASFDGGAEGFVYSDNVFRGATEADYVDPVLRRHGDIDDGGNLMVFTGGYDQDPIGPMSGAWETTFTLAEATDVVIEADYRLFVADTNEPGEYGEALLAIDGTLYGNAGNDYIELIDGGGDSGWNTFTTTLSLSAGSHTISVGGHHSSKNQRTEETEISFGRILIAPTAPGVGFTSPAEGEAAAGSQLFELRATDLADPSSSLTVDVSTDDGATWVPATWDAATDRFQLTHDVSGLPEGPFTLLARATDTDGNATSISTDFLIDNDGNPSVAIVDPADGATITATVTLAVAATDAEDPPGSLLVEISTDDEATWQSAAWNAAAGRYEYSWDTTSVPPGSRTVYARATDSSPVTVDATPIAVTVVADPGTTYPDTVLGDGATVYWRLGDTSGTTAADELGNNDATYVGSPGLGVAGLITNADGAVSFDGATDYVSIANSPDINQGGPYSEKTIELWFRADDLVGRQTLYEQGSVTRGINLYLDGGLLYAGAWNTSTVAGDPTTPWGPVWLSTPVAAGEAYHAAAVFDSSADAFRLYLNGAEVDSASGIGQLHNHSLSAMGAQRDWSRYHTGAVQGELFHFDGTLDEVALYPTALGGTTIANHFGIGAQTLSDPTATIVGPAAFSTVAGTEVIAVDASDPDDPQGSLSVEVSTDGAATWAQAAWNPGNGLYEYSWDTTVEPPGSVTIDARVTDSTGATATATPVTVFIDSYPDTVLGDNPAVYWRLGESSGLIAVDEIGGNDAEYAGSPALGAVPLVSDPSTAVGFDGTDDRVAVTNSFEINQGGPYLTKTIELWFDAAAATNRQVLWEQGSIGRSLNLYIEGGRLYAGAANTTAQGGDTPWGPVFISAPVTAGEIHHAVVVFDQPNDSFLLYLDGNLAASAGGIGELHNHGLAAIGAQADWSRFHTGAQQGAINHFAGTIDEVALYSYALDATQVGDHWTIGSQVSSLPTVFILDPAAGAVVGGTHTVRVDASDADEPAGALDVEVSADGGSSWAPAAWNSANGTYEFVWDTTLHNEGGATLQARATDAAANTVLSAAVPVTVDNDADPAVVIAAPTEGEVVAGNVTIQVDASDAEDPPGSLFVEVSSDAGGTWEPAAFTGTFYELAWDTAAGPDGGFILDARVTDSAGITVGALPVAVTVDNNGDPIVAITSPTAGAVVGDVTLVEVDASDPEDPAGSLLVEVSTDGGGSWNTAPWNAASSRYEYTWDSGAHGDGAATIESRASDSGGSVTTASPVAVTVKTFAGTAAADGASVHWRLGDVSGATATDEYGLNDAAYVGGVTLGVPGLIDESDTAARFDGSDDTVHIANSNEVNQGGPYFVKTVELWFQADEVGRRQVIYEQGSVSRGLSIYIDNGLLYAGAYNTNDMGGDTPWGPVFLTTPIAADTIYQVVLVFDVSTDSLLLYVNGSLAASGSGVGSLHDHGLSAIGSGRDWVRFHDGASLNGPNFFAGVIDEVVIYPFVLQPAVVADHFTFAI